MGRLNTHDLEQLKELGLREHKEFFKRNPHLKVAYYNSLVGIFLCQGGASYYLNYPNSSLKDFDIWHFYIESGSLNFPYRAHKTLKNSYKGKNIDFLKRAIPGHMCNSFPKDPAQIVMRCLCERDTKTKKLLLQKPIIGVFPEDIFGKVIWEWSKG